MAQVRISLEEIENDAIPHVCMLCGEPSSTIVRRKFSWCPSWVPVLLLAGLWPYVIVALILTKSRRMGVPLCESHRNHWSWRFWVNWAAFLAFACLVGAVIATLISLDGQHRGDSDPVVPLLVMSLPVLFVSWLGVVVVLQSTALRAAEITDRDITFNKVAVAFADALEDEREREELRARARPYDLKYGDGIPVVCPLD